MNERPPTEDDEKHFAALHRVLYLMRKVWITRPEFLLRAEEKGIPVEDFFGEVLAEALNRLDEEEEEVEQKEQAKETKGDNP